MNSCENINNDSCLQFEHLLCELKNNDCIDKVVQITDNCETSNITPKVCQSIHNNS